MVFNKNWSEHNNDLGVISGVSFSGGPLQGSFNFKALNTFPPIKGNYYQNPRDISLMWKALRQLL